MLEVEELTQRRMVDLDLLFGSDPVTDRCWCMWFLMPVKAFHEAGHDGNRASLERLREASPLPLGLIAYEGRDTVGWCAVGPRQRYTRALAAPTLKERDRSEDTSVWLVPCFFIRRDARGKGVSTALLRAAVELARANGATAIEGFPLAGAKRRSGGSDFMTGVEPLFAACGFEAVARPSPNRVIMRKKL